MVISNDLMRDERLKDFREGYFMPLNMRRAGLPSPIPSRNFKEPTACSIDIDFGARSIVFGRGRASSEQKQSKRWVLAELNGASCRDWTEIQPV